MSELDRHTTATEAEEVRHAVAGETEMALHVDNTRTPDELHAEVQIAQHRARRAALVFGIIVGLIVLMAMTVAAVAVRTSQRNGQRIVALTDQLADARKVVADATDDELTRSRCERVLQAAVRTASRETSAGIGRLVIIIATVVPEERETQIGNAVIELQKALDAYDRTAKVINAWQVMPVDQQLKCPTPI